MYVLMRGTVPLKVSEDFELLNEYTANFDVAAQAEMSIVADVEVLI